MYMFIYSKCVSFCANFCHDFPFIATNYIDESRERERRKNTNERRETKFFMLVRIKVHNITISTRLSPCPFQTPIAFRSMCWKKKYRNKMKCLPHIFFIFVQMKHVSRIFFSLTLSSAVCTRVLMWYTHSHPFLFGSILGLNSDFPAHSYKFSFVIQYIVCRVLLTYALPLL